MRSIINIQKHQDKPVQEDARKFLQGDRKHIQRRNNEDIEVLLCLYLLDLRIDYLVVGIRGKFVSYDDVRGKEELDALLGSDLLKFAGKVKLQRKYQKKCYIFTKAGKKNLKFSIDW